MTHAVKSEWKTSSGKKGFQSGSWRTPRLRPAVQIVMTGIMRRCTTTTPTRAGCAKNPAQLPQASTMRKRKQRTLRGIPRACLRLIPGDFVAAASTRPPFPFRPDPPGAWPHSSARRGRRGTSLPAAAEFDRAASSALVRLPARRRRERDQERLGTLEQDLARRAERCLAGIAHGALQVAAQAVEHVAHAAAIWHLHLL